MTEIAMRRETALDVQLAPVQSATFERLAAWAQAAQAAHQMATSLVKTSFVPMAFRDKPHEATAAILAGAELGFDPMASLRSFDVIEGNAAPRAITLRAVVQSRGHRMWVEESTATRAIVQGIRQGETKVQESVWTLERAKHLTGKKNWREQPTAMLIARATSECARLVAADAILGIPYSSEELEDGVDVAVVEEIKPARRTARRAVTAAVEAPPAPEPDFDEPAVAAPDELKPSREQMNMMFALFGKVGPEDRGERLAYIEKLIRRAIASSSDLTVAEVSTVIDDLKAQEVAASIPDAQDFGDDWPETAAVPDAES